MKQRREKRDADRKKRRWSINDYQNLVAMAKDNVSVDVVAERLNRTTTAVRIMASILNRNRDEKDKIILKRRKL